MLLDRRSGADAGLGKRGRRLRGSPQSAPGPLPAPPPLSRTPAALTLEGPAGQPSEATSQPGTGARSPDAPPAAPPSASGASPAAQRAVRSADSWGAGRGIQWFMEERSPIAVCSWFPGWSEENLLAITEDNHSQAKNNRCDYFECIFILGKLCAFEAMEYSFEHLRD